MTDKETTLEEVISMIGRKQIAIEEAYKERILLIGIIKQLVNKELPIERVQVSGDSVTVLPEVG